MTVRRQRPLLIVAGLVLAMAAAPSMAEPPDGFVARVGSLRRATGVPGLSIAIIEQGRTTLAHGWGVRQLGGSEPVGADTIFPTGSTGKAFTTAALATLVDVGRIGWNDPVIAPSPLVPHVRSVSHARDHHPRPARPQERPGTGPRRPAVRPAQHHSRREAVRRLRFLKRATSVRSGYAYDNVPYMVAGQLIEKVTGQRWEEYVRENALRPAGPTRTTTDSPARFATPNRAQPHARLNGGLRGAGDQVMLDERDELAASAAPAGGLSSSANDLSRWLTLQLAHGRLGNGERLFSEAARAAMWQP